MNNKKKLFDFICRGLVRQKILEKDCRKRTKVLDRRTKLCYYERTFFICQMRLSRKSSRNEGFRELPGGARQ